MKVSNPSRWRLRVVCGLVVVYLLAPTVVVIPLSFTDRPSFEFPPPGFSLDYYRNFFTKPAWRDALVNSAKRAVVVSILATALGTAAAFGLRRFTRLSGGAVRAFLGLPVIVPGIVTAVAIYGAFLRWHLVGTMIGFTLAHAALAIPFVLITVSTSLARLDP